MARAARRLARGAAHLLDRSDPAVKNYQDAALNFGLFAAAVLAIHRFGHKLAV